MFEQNTSETPEFVFESGSLLVGSKTNQLCSRKAVCSEII
jgi:hypothetical protein